MKARYLLFFSYIGTPFRSSEKIWMKGKKYPDPESVQGMIELALLKLHSVNYPNLTLSSRTDGGVHALNSAAHVDLERVSTGVYDTKGIRQALNKFFIKTNTSIIIKKCLRVQDNFCARRSAICRTYLYRLAVVKKDIDWIENYKSLCLPVEEWKRCHFMRLPNFDIEKFKEGAKYFVGYHDFSTFKKFDKLSDTKHNRREIYSIEVKPGRPLVTSYTNKLDTVLDYWDIEIKGKSFVHNQIRRMVGTLNSVAVGKLNSSDIKLMLQVPSKHSWHGFLQTGPPDGLYLCDVQYNPEDLMYDDANSEQTLDKYSCDTDSD